MDDDTATTVISWTPEKLELLKRQLKEADSDGVIQFEGHDIFVPYGNHLVDYLTSRFNP